MDSVCKAKPKGKGRSMWKVGWIQCGRLMLGLPLQCQSSMARLDKVSVSVLYTILTGTGSTERP